MSIWDVLGIDPTSEERDIKRAYARKLKVTRPEDDPTAFQLLNDAFQHALAHARFHTAEDDSGFALAPMVITAAETAVAPVPTQILPVLPARPTPLAPPPPTGPTAAEQARTLWATFIGTSTVQPRLGLNKLSNSDALLNLDVREQFELCAAQYCASAACSPDMLEVIAAHFRWETDHALIARALPVETLALFAQLRAEQSYAMFRQHQTSDPAVKALLAPDAMFPWLQATDARFMRKMRDLLPAIREFHPEMLQFKLDQLRFAYWEQCVARKRYYVQTALYSFIASVVLAVLAMFIVGRLDSSDRWFGAAAIASTIVGFGGFGWYAFRRREPGQTFRNSALGTRLHVLLYDVRYRPRWQFGWLVPFALASTAMFLPQPSALVGYLVGATLVACVLAASFANSAAMNGWAFFISIAMSIGLGTALSEKAFAFHPTSCVMLVYCAFQMLIRGGQDLLGMVALPPTAILPLRCGWLAGVAALIALAMAPFALAIPASFAAVSWLWLLAGMLLARPSIHFMFALLGTFALQGMLANAAPKPSLLTVQPMTQVLATMLYVTFFMVVNMVRVRRTQHPFS